MTHPDIQSEALLQRGRQLWPVRMARRALTFQEELAARSFAAQLHVHLAWLKQQAIQENLGN